MSTSVRNALIIDVVIAITAHVWYRNREPKSLFLLFVTIVILSLPTTFLLLPHVGSLVTAFLFAYITLIATLLNSIGLYRLSPFHPLESHPGPLRCKLTKLWTAWVGYKGKPHLYYKALHDQYGPIVRVGPNELSIVDVELIPYILGPQGMPKGPMWEGRRILPSKKYSNNNSLNGVRNLQRHAQLRKPWNTAFHSTALLEYDDMLIKRAAVFIERLKGICEGSDEGRVDLAKWISLFSFDFMGDFAFGGVYSLMTDEDVDGILPTLKRGLFLPSIAAHIPWSSRLLRMTPFLGKDLQAVGKFAVDQGRKRASQSESVKDLFYHLLKGAKADSIASAIHIVVSNSLLAIVAGSDTTATVLSNIIFYLLSNPKYQNYLKDEIDAVFVRPETNNALKSNILTTLPLLNAVINETLRLQPPVASALQRAPAQGSGGKRLGPELFITEGTAVQVPPYVLHRDPRYFSPNPDKFWPERWLRRDSTIVLERSAFIPFSTGPANCPGKPLAMMELRYLICLLLTTFEISFDEHYDPKSWEEGLEDRFILLKGALPVSLKIRRFDH
ncbi:cytochrome P450 [Crassisporium funariophilum]|nr:cytochrome P450 [Crassisporium funariophilum]